VTDAVAMHEAQLIGEADWIAAGEICRLCRLELDTVAELADLGVIRPRGQGPEHWQLPAAALPRLALIGRLMRDLGIDVGGAALAMELLEVQRDLERRIRRLEQLMHP
jgi:chaperone modulatory protein CbpM